MVPKKHYFDLYGKSKIYLGWLASPQQLLDLLEYIKPGFCKASSISSRVRYLRKIFPQSISVHQSIDPFIGSINLLGGFCEYSLEMTEVGVILYYSNKGKQNELTENEWKEFCISAIQTVSHELIHASQYKRAKNKIKDLKENGYLDDPTEIDAFAHCALIESVIRKDLITYDPIVAWRAFEDGVKSYYLNKEQRIRKRFISKFFKWGYRLSKIESNINN